MRIAVDSPTSADGNVLDGVLSLHEKIVSVPARVGLDVPALAVQLTLLVLLGVALVPLLRAALRRQKLTATAPAAVTLGLATALVVVGLVAQLLLPGYVAGRISAGALDGVRVHVRDFSGRRISAGEGIVDTETGLFVLYYRPWLDGRASTLVIEGCGEKAVEFPISRAALQSGDRSRILYRCGGAP